MEKDPFFTHEGSGWNPQQLNCSPNCYPTPHWEAPMDQSDPFESALSSIVSSPVASNSAMAGGESVVLRELIGRLGSICSSGEASNGNNSATTSCYTTPLNSPPKLNLSIMDHHHHHHQQPVGRNHQIPAPQFPPDPGFVERAARFSCFGGKEGGYPQGVASPDKRLVCLGQENKEMDGSMEESSVSEQIPGGETGIRGRKRKGVLKGKGKEKETQSSTLKVDQAEKEESDAKRSKSNEEGNGHGNQKQTKEKENAKPPEPPKDYIHVRARRGQATDSHSLAERVRREKISERMKFLQDLVPGCNKVTGKAVMLDEIINYVQSLQRQVEFLSMKLATVNPRVDVSMESLLSKDMFQPNSVDTSFSYGFQTIPDGVENPSSMNSLMAFMHHSSSTKLAHIDGFSEASAAAALWESDLQSVVQMGFGQNQQQSFHGTMGTSQMKVEL